MDIAKHALLDIIRVHMVLMIVVLVLQASMFHTLEPHHAYDALLDTSLLIQDHHHAHNALQISIQTPSDPHPVDHVPLMQYHAQQPASNVPPISLDREAHVFQDHQVVVVHL